jgi:predicted Fe-Mo cluster-binding NifX family protein
MQHLKTLDVYEIIRDCRWVISARIGKLGVERLRARGMKLIFKNGAIDEALKSFLNEEVNRT